MSDFIKRLNEEKIDLHDRMIKLEKFLSDGDLSSVDLKEQGLLRQQLEHMKQYYGVLNQRCYFHSVGKWPFN